MQWGQCTFHCVSEEKNHTIIYTKVLRYLGEHITWDTAWYSRSFGGENKEKRENKQVKSLKEWQVCLSVSKILIHSTHFIMLQSLHEWKPLRQRPLLRAKDVFLIVTQSTTEFPTLVSKPTLHNSLFPWEYWIVWYCLELSSLLY